MGTLLSHWSRMGRSFICLLVVFIYITSAGARLSPFFPAIVYDFNVDHTSFERYGGSGQEGTVEANYLTWRKPVFYGGVTNTTEYLDMDQRCPNCGGTGGAKREEYFQMFFRDMPGHNIRIPVLLQFNETVEGTGVFELDRQPRPGSTAASFLPIDGLGFGHDIRQAIPPSNPGRETQNFNLCMEFHSEFIYNGTEFFSFSGDDDVYVFINNKLVVDLGGLHPARAAAVSLPAVASRVGLVRGLRYPFSFFICERHWSGSNLKIVTTIARVNQRPNTQPSAFTLMVGETVSDFDFVASDPDLDPLTYTLTIPDELAPFLTVGPDSSTATFTAPESLDAFIAANETTYTFSMSFTVADNEFTACPSDVTFTVIRILQPPPAPAATPPPADNTETIIIASVASVLGVALVVGVLALLLYLRSKVETYKMEVLCALNQDNLEVNPLYEAGKEDNVNPLYDDTVGGAAGSFF